MSVDTAVAMDIAVAIVTVTLNPTLDTWASVPRVELTPGGGGINVARAAHRLGGVATAILPAATGGGDGAPVSTSACSGGYA